MEAQSGLRSHITTQSKEMDTSRKELTGKLQEGVVVIDQESRRERLALRLWAVVDVVTSQFESLHFVPVTQCHPC